MGSENKEGKGGVGGRAQREEREWTGEKEGNGRKGRGRRKGKEEDLTLQTELHQDALHGQTMSSPSTNQLYPMPQYHPVPEGGEPYNIHCNEISNHHTRLAGMGIKGRKTR